MAGNTPYFGTPQISEEKLQTKGEFFYWFEFSPLIISKIDLESQKYYDETLVNKRISIIYFILINL